MNLLGAASYPGQVLYLCVRSDAGIAFFPAVLHIPQVEHTGDYVQQLLRRENTAREGEGKIRTRKNNMGRKIEGFQRGGERGPRKTLRRRESTKVER